MTQIKFSNRPVSRSFNNLVDDFFATAPSMLRSELYGANRQSAPVNIFERDNAYVLEVVAPGMEKDQFKIDLDNNILTISASPKEAQKHLNEKSLRREYSHGAFKRSFTLDEVIDADNIAASYNNGILTLTLPKKAQVKPAVKQINIQ